MWLRRRCTALFVACFAAGCTATPITLPGDQDGAPQSKPDVRMTQDAAADFFSAPDKGTVGQPDAPGVFFDSAGPMPDAGAGDGWAGDAEAGVTEVGPGEGGVTEGGPGEGGPGEGGLPAADLASAD